MSMKQIKYSIDTINEVVEMLYSMMVNYKVITFTGSLGAGKTTLVKALLRRCGVQGVITSPTFTYVNVYENDRHQTYYHFDCYRITSVDEFTLAGFDEYLYQPDSWVFIEWPEVILPLVENKVIHVAIEYDENQRMATFITKD